MTEQTSSEVSPEYEPAPATVPTARRFVTSTLDRWGATDIDDAALLTSELVTNAVLHAKSTYTVTVDLFDDRVRISVLDSSTDAARPRHHDPTSATGRGLGMVATLSTTWGVEARAQGKCVWFELPRRPHRPHHTTDDDDPTAVAEPDLA